MALQEYEKEEALQRQKIEREINRSEIGDRNACRALAESAAEAAFHRFFRFRFGIFEGEEACIVFVNMGRNNQSARDRFRRRIEEIGARELAVAVWPPADDPDAHYSWAVFINDVFAADWIEEAQTAWIKENAD